MTMMKTLALTMTATAGLLAMAPKQADACSPPLPVVDLRFQTEDGSTMTREPKVLFSASPITPSAPEKFTLVNTTTQTSLEVTTELVQSGNYTSYYTLSPTSPLEEGGYTLSYETEDPTGPIGPGGPALYTRELTFQISSAATHPGKLDVGMEWSRVRPGPGDPLFEDSCGGSNAQQDRVELTFPASCRTEGAGIKYQIDFIGGRDQVLYSYLRTVSSDDIADQSDAEGLITSVYQSQTQNGALAECIRVTPMTTSGVRGEPVELCVPTRCATGSQFPADESAYASCENPDGLPTSVDLADPYVADSCELASGFDPCDDVVCSDTQACVDGACVEVDPCDDVACADGEVCVEGACEVVIIDPCDGVTCAAGETCEAGVCEGAPEPDLCEGVTCDEADICFEGECYTKVTPDACDAITCGDTQLCYEGQCYDIEDNLDDTIPRRRVGLREL